MVAVLILVLRNSPKGRGRVPNSASGKRRMAKRLRAEGKSGQAGELFLEAGDLDTALQTFLQAGLTGRAAPIFEKQGDLQGALDAYQMCGEHERAALMATKLGDPATAAHHYTLAKNFSKAARQWALAGDAARSGHAWWQAGECLKAAETFHKAGMALEAGKAYCYLLDLERARSGGAPTPMGDSPNRSYNLPDLARLAGHNLLEGGEPLAAAQSFLIGGLGREAADALAKGGRPADAAKVLVDIGELAGAAKLFERAGEPELVAKVKARLSLELGNPGEAAGHLERLGDVVGAAQLRTRTGEHTRAAELFEEGEQWAASGSAWEQAGNLAKAATAHERAGDPARAAELHRKLGDQAGEIETRRAAGDWVRLGELLMAAERVEEAEEALRSVKEGDSGWLKACELLGHVYRLQGKMAPAAVKYRQALGRDSANDSNQEVYHLLGVCASEGGEHRLAIAALAALREHDPTYKDVQQRFETVQRALAAEEVDKSAGEKRYTRGDLLGKGGMGAVYRAMDAILEREVAFKVLPKAAVGDPAAREGFLREARSAAALNHGNIVQVYDFGEAGGEPYIVMELVEGDTLKAMMKADGPLGIDLLLDVLQQSCAGLAYAHKRGVIHRDIKPVNLMWTPGNELKIADFGLAKLMKAKTATRDDPEGDAAVEAELGELRLQAKAGAQEGSETHIVGTPQYMSPEQILQDGVDHRTDLYALGVSLYELACGRVPFRKGNVLLHHIKSAPQPPSVHREDMPPWLEAVILRCMAKSKEDRYPDVATLVASLPA